MGIFQQLRQLFTKPVSSVPDKSFGLFERLGIGSMLTQRQWLQLEAVAAQLSPDDLTGLLDGLCLTDAHASALASYQQAGKSDLRRLIAGVHATHVAWQIRGGAYAKYLGEAQVAGFQQHLAEAYEQLTTPFTSPTYQAEAAARTVRVAMGLSEPEVAQQAFERSVALVPGQLQAHLFYFNVLTPKWFGDEEKLERFVDAEAAPAHRPLLQAMYAVELFFQVADSTELVQQQTRNELAPRLKALERAAPLTDDSLYAVYFNNYMACLQHLVGQVQARTVYLRVLGSRITPYPWAYFGLNEADVQQLASSNA